MTTEDAAHELALTMIRRMVESGLYTDQEIGQYRGGKGNREYNLDIGGMRCRVHQKLHGGNIVHVTRVNRIECCHVYQVDALIKEAREPERSRQIALLG